MELGGGQSSDERQHDVGNGAFRPLACGAGSARYFIPREIHLLSMITVCRRMQAFRSPIKCGSTWPFLVNLLVGLFAQLPLAAVAFEHTSGPETELARELYLDHCEACHGVDLEGQADWRNVGANGLYPAPPHDETGHTWHHDDAMLTNYITRGGQAVLDDMGVAFTSGMPGFSSVLSDQEIKSILNYIKPTWPKHIYEIQSQRSNAVALE